MPGYSATPLVRKLGYREGFRVWVYNAPEQYLGLLAPLPGGVTFHGGRAREVDLVHLFLNSRKELLACLPKAIKMIRQEGMIWVSWPKKSSGVKTDLDENFIRDTALNSRLVDVKVCAVTDVWSGLKLVIPVAERTK